MDFDFMSSADSQAELKMMIFLIRSLHIFLTMQTFLERSYNVISESKQCCHHAGNAGNGDIQKGNPFSPCGCDVIHAFCIST